MNAKHSLSLNANRLDARWTSDDVANQLEEALQTLKKLPPVRVQGYFCLWPDGGYSLQDLLEQEVQPLRLQATAAAITRLEQTLSWMHWLSIKERKLLWYRAAHVSWKEICFRLGFGRTTAWSKWLVSLNMIADRLNGM